MTSPAIPPRPLVGALGRAWPFAPIALVLLVLFFLPIMAMVAFSFWTTKDFQVVPVWNLENYTRVLSNDVYVRTFVKTLVMGLLVTVAGIMAALPFAYFLVRYVSKRWQRIVLVAVIVPFWTSYLLRVYAWQAILGEKGILNSVLLYLHIIDQPSQLFLYNNLGVFIVLLYVYFPFAVLAVYTSLENFDFDLLRAAQDLGARPDQAIRRILLPRIRPGLITACIFVFVPILGEYLTPTLVGGTEGVLISNVVVSFFRAGLIPAGAAPAILIAAIVTILLVAFRRYLRLEDVVTRG